MGLSLQRLLRYADEGENVLNKNVTGDDSWMPHYQPESTRASTQWTHPSSSATEKFKVTSTPSTGKIMLNVFWDSQGVLFAHFQKRGENATSAWCRQDLLKLRDAIRRKSPGQLA
jgi:hypothetical protein